jgi:cell wall-associated NlpC family hydrolase
LLVLKKVTKLVLCLLVISIVVSALPSEALASNGARGERVIQVGLSLLGRPYVFGANGPYSFDCSSFVRHVLYRATGIRMPRTALSQSRVGTRIPRSDLARGDLIFFKNTYKAGVSHVGFYMGNNRILHAMPRKGVIVDSLNTRYARAKYHSSRTVLR